MLNLYLELEKFPIYEKTCSFRQLINYIALMAKKKGNSQVFAHEFGAFRQTLGQLKHLKGMEQLQHIEKLEQLEQLQQLQQLQQLEELEQFEHI